MQIETIVVGEFQVNCFVVWGAGKQAIVIDPGKEADRIEDAIEANGLTIGVYLLTHGHMDHISALADLYDKWPAPIALHAADAKWAFDAANEMPPFYPVPRKPADITRLLDEGQSWTDDGLAYRILNTPGHTPGSVCVLFEADNTLFSGDTLFAGSVGRTDFPGGDPRALRQSLVRLAELPDETIVHTGHGPSTNIGVEKRTNFFMQGAW